MLLGISLGIGSHMKGSLKIPSSVGRFDGSRTSIFLIKFLALSEMVVVYGNS